MPKISSTNDVKESSLQRLGDGPSTLFNQDKPTTAGYTSSYGGNSSGPKVPQTTTV